MITLFGSGKTTTAIAKRFKRAIFFEDTPRAYQDKEGFWHLPSQKFDPNTSAIEIPSPGIPPSHPLIQQAKHLCGEYDFFRSDMPYSIWISGTNGKTTTTQMITHLLRSRGAISGGNIGTPLANLPSNASLWVLESSSFSLHYTSLALPDLYILLPITPDHLSWHGSFKAYEAAKLSPIARLKESQIAIVPTKYANIATCGTLIGYKTPQDLAKIFGLDPNALPFQGPFLLDALLALAVERILFGQSDHEKMAAFLIDSHKQEEFYDSKGRLWVDDSKATNIDATIQALRRYKDKKIYLILGGDDKGVSLEPLFDHLENVEIFAIGKASEQIMALAQKYNIPAHAAKTLPNAVAMIKKLHTPNSVALLSPACASLDQFRSYKERGEIFKREVLS